MTEPLLVALDANAVDRVASGGDAPAQCFRGLLAEGRIRLFVPPGVAAEVSQAHGPAALRAMLDSVAPSTRVRPSARRDIDRIRIRAMLRGDGRPGKHDADAAHLSDAAEAGCGFFVTADGKILRKRDILATGLPPGLAIVTLPELVSAIAPEPFPPAASDPRRGSE